MADRNVIRIRKKRRVRRHSKSGILSRHQATSAKVKVFHIIIALILAFIAGVMVLRYIENDSPPATVEQR
jgi:hypothetical protein